MDSRDLVVALLCGVLIVVGAIILRISPRDRGAGAIMLLVGLGALLAYLFGEDQPIPDYAATPSAEAADPFASATVPVTGD